MIISQEFGLYGGIFLAIAYLALARMFNLYRKYRYIDKAVHAFFGVVVAMFMIDNNYSIFIIILINLISAVVWEWFQILVKKRVGFKKVGFPDGYGDIIWHMIGTLGYLIYKGLLIF